LVHQESSFVFCVIQSNSVDTLLYVGRAIIFFAVPIIFFLSVTECINFFNSQVNRLLGPIIEMQTKNGA